MNYYNVGKLLYEASKHYGEIIKNIINDLGKRYTFTNLKYMRQSFFILAKKSRKCVMNQIGLVIVNYYIDNKFIMEYVSNGNIFKREYLLI